MSEPRRCTLDDRDEHGFGRCSCGLVVAAGGDCPFGPPLTPTPTTEAKEAER